MSEFEEREVREARREAKEVWLRHTAAEFAQQILQKDQWDHFDQGMRKQICRIAVEMAECIYDTIHEHVKEEYK